MGMVAAGGRRLAAQMAVSMVAATCAAFVAPQLLGLIGQGGKAPARMASLPHVAAPADFEAAFVWPVQTPPGIPRDLVRPAVPVPSGAPVAAPLPVARPIVSLARAGLPRSRPAAVPAGAAAGEPLQLAAMITPALIAPAPAAQPRRVLGVPVPKLPYEDQVTGALVRARDAVRGLF